jgi:hypothetical protein
VELLAEGKVGALELAFAGLLGQTEELVPQAGLDEATCMQELVLLLVTQFDIEGEESALLRAELG